MRSVIELEKISRQVIEVPKNVVGEIGYEGAYDSSEAVHYTVEHGRRGGGREELTAEVVQGRRHGLQGMERCGLWYMLAQFVIEVS
jgi:hypothetical protein